MGLVAWGVRVAVDTNRRYTFTVPVDVNHKSQISTDRVFLTI